MQHVCVEPAHGNARHAFELNNKHPVCNAASFYRSLPIKNGSAIVCDDRVAPNTRYLCEVAWGQGLGNAIGRCRCGPCCAAANARVPNSRYPSRAISTRAADGTKTRGPATARPRAKPVGAAGTRRGRAAVADAQTGGRPTDARYPSGGAAIAAPARASRVERHAGPGADARNRRSTTCPACG